MTREHKLALIVGFSLFLVLGVLISDHFSKARQVELAENIQPSNARQMGAGVSPGLQVERSASQPMPSPVVVINGQPRGDLLPLPPQGASLRSPAATPQGTTQVAMGPRQPFTPLAAVDGHPGDIAPHLGPDETSHPGGSAAAATSQIPVQKYEVKEGDTLYRITSKTYGDAKLVEKVREYNKLTSGETIHIGGTILLPPKDVLLGKPYVPTGVTADAPANKPDAKSADGFREYVVKSGDTLMGIARKMLSSDARYSEIEEANPGVDSSSLKIGQKLKIPAK